MCQNDNEHMCHVFFDCEFASSCWHYAGLVYDMEGVNSASEWLLYKLSSASSDEIMKIVKVLWGVWFWRNKRVWENKKVHASTAMDWSTKEVSDWRTAQEHVKATTRSCSGGVSFDQKWKPPEPGSLKLNVDASVHPGAQSFKVGMVLRDHMGSFVAGKTLCLPGQVSVFEAEAIGMDEALSWILSRPLHRTVIETDSLLTVQAITKTEAIRLEVGNVIDSCRQRLKASSGISISFVRKQANKVAHEVAKFPCLLGCYNIFTSPPKFLLETLMYLSLIHI